MYRWVPKLWYCVHYIHIQPVTLWPYRNYSIRKLEEFNAFRGVIDDSRFVLVISVAYTTKPTIVTTIVRITMRLYYTHTSLSSSIRIFAMRLHVIVYFCIGKMPFILPAHAHTHTRKSVAYTRLWLHWNPFNVLECSFDSYTWCGHKTSENDFNIPIYTNWHTDL